jgi:hypothetical protein
MYNVWRGDLFRNGPVTSFMKDNTYNLLPTTKQPTNQIIINIGVSRSFSHCDGVVKFPSFPKSILGAGDGTQLGPAITIMAVS